MKPSELLEKKGWCQHVYARNAAGVPVMYDNESACRFCILGAMEAAGKNLDELKRLRAHMINKYKSDPASWNDQPGRTKEEVIALLKELDL